MVASLLPALLFLSVLALRELDQGPTFVLGTAMSWITLCVSASLVAKLTEQRGNVLTLVALELLTICGGLAVGCLEPRFWPPVERFHGAEALREGVGSMHVALLAWSFMTYVPSLRDKVRSRGVEAKSAAIEAELSSIRARLTPHFLRNTLHTVSALTMDDPARARSVMGALADLLEDPGSGELEPLGRQLSWLRSYVAILEARFDALSVEWNVEDGLGEIMVPRFILQPIVENAVEHGALAREHGPGVVRIDVRPDGWDYITCTVEDNGPGYSENVDSLGLYSVRRRLALLAPGATLEVLRREPGTAAVIRLPLHRERSR